MLAKINNSKGITLVELLATLVIVSIVASLSYSVLSQGYSNYQRIQAEAELRDEADLIMSSFIKDIFVLKGEEIEMESICLDGSSTTLMKITKRKPINSEEVIEQYNTGFKDGEVIVKDQPVHFHNNSVTLLENDCNGELYNLITEEKDNTEYKIKFTLKTLKGKQEHTMDFENTVQVINGRGD